MDNWEKSYKDYLKNLPEYKAPASVWKRLEVSKFTVNKAGLPVYSPSQNLWNRIEKSYLYQRRIYKWMAMVLLMLALAIPGGIVIDSYVSDQDAAFLNENNENTSMVEITEERNEDPEFFDDLMIMIPKPSSEIKRVNGAPVLNQPKIVQPKQVVLYAERPEVSLTKFSSKKGLLPLDLNDKPAKRNRVNECSPFHSSHEFLFGPYYEYQYFLEGNTYMNTEQKYWHSFGVNARLNFRKFFLESGIGMSLSKDKINWKYDYLQNELVNTYVYVDSVHYDPITGETYFYTSLIEVYDSVSYTQSNTINNKHYYLKVPLFAGFELFKKRNFCTSLIGGLMYHFLLQEKETVLHYEEPNARITKVYYDKTKRLRHLFCASIRINFEYNLQRKMMFYAYPSVNYCLNPIYDGSGAKTPLSIGFGVGVYFR